MVSQGSVLSVHQCLLCRLRSLLLFTLLCTCGSASSQIDKAPQGLFGGKSITQRPLQLSIDAGYSFGSFNRQPELVGQLNSSGGDFLRALNSATTSLDFSYAPASTNISWGLRVGYSRRGYEHRVEQENGGFSRGNLIPSRVHYADITPRITYRPCRLLSASIGPYVSLGQKFEDNPFVLEPDRRTFSTDYGISLEGRIHLGRLYGYAGYQRSMRNYNYSTISEGFQLPVGVVEATPISALRLGFGFTILR